MIRIGVALTLAVGLLLAALPAAAADGVGPVLAYTAPTQNQIVTTSPVTFSGTAVDVDGVTTAEVAIRNRDTSLWLKANGTWVVDLQRLPATLLPGPGATSATWSWSYPLVTGRYQAIGYATDGGGTRTKGPDRYFEMKLAPTVTISTPTASQSFSSSPVAFGGTAADDLGVSAVSYAVQNTATSQWWQTNGTWGTTRVTFPATLASPGATATAWTASWPAPVGSFRVEATATDSSALTSPTPGVAFTRIDPAPSIVLTTPTQGQAFATSPVVFAGTAADDLGVSSVRVAVQNRANGLWSQGDGTWASTRVTVPATLVSPGATGTSWSFSWDAPGNGQFRAEVDAVDTATQSSPVAGADFDLTDAPPGVTISTPGAGSTVTATPVAVTGTATDDVGVAAVKVAFQDTVSGLWYQPDTSWGAARQEFDTALASPGAASSTWSYAWPAPVYGSYRVEARAIDTVSSSSGTSARQFTFFDSDPLATITSPTAGQVVPTAPVAVSGGASDDVGVSGVKVAFKNRNTGLWWQTNGTWDVSRVEFDASLASPGAVSTTWSTPFAPGAYDDYRAEVRSLDTAGHSSAPASVDFTFRDDAPTVSVAHPLSGQVVALRPIAVDGNVTDDTGVASVAVAYQDRVSGLWYQTDGSWAATRVEFAATLTAPGGTATSWSTSWTPVVNGSYRVEATGVDEKAQRGTTVGVDFTFLDAAPAITVSSPTAGQAFSTVPIGLSGSAADDLGVASVKVAIRNTGTGQWLQANDTWGPTRVERDAALGTPNGTSTAWTFTFGPGGAGAFSLEATATDSVGQPSSTSTVAFSYDDAAPTVVISSPTDGQQLATPAVGLGGSASDDLGVTAVKYAIQNVATSQWWNGTAFQASRVEFDANLAVPGATFTTWSAAWTAPAFGQYRLEARTADSTGHTSSTASAAFGYTDQPPAASITAPYLNQVFQVPSVGFAGTATDDQGVSSVGVAVRDTATGMWLQANGTWAATRVTAAATLASPGAPSTGWSLSRTLGRTGSFVAEVTAVDAGAKVSSIASVGFTAVPQFNSARTRTWSTNGKVYGVTSDGANRVYVGGQFDQVGPSQGGAVGVSATSGSVLANTPLAAGPVYTAVPDNNGGWYVGGDFNNVDNKYRRGVAHINANGTLDATFSPRPNGTVYAIAVDYPRNRVYIGGSFSAVQQEPHNRIAALDLTTGTPIASWTVSTNNEVRALALSPDGNTLYVGGKFTTLLSNRNRLAAVNPGTGALLSFNPNAGGDVYDLALDATGSTLYVGGAFTSLGGSTRNRIGAVTSAGSLVSTFNPNANNTVWSLVADGSTVYAGGAFTSIGGQSRPYAAALGTNGLATGFNPAPNGEVRDLRPGAPGTVLMAGNFTTAGGQPRNRVASFDTAGVLQAWNPNASDFAYAAVPNSSGTSVMIGGSFSFVGGTTRNNAAAFDLSAGGANVDSWSANTNGIVWTVGMAPGDSAVYLGGEFTTVGGAPRQRLAKVSTASGAADPGFVADADNMVRHLEVNGSYVYAGGLQININGKFTGRLGRVNRVTGATDQNWTPAPDEKVNGFAFSPDGSIVYVAGQFTMLGGAGRRCIGAVNVVNATANTTWAPNTFAGSGVLNCYDLSVTPDGSRIYLATGGHLQNGGNRIWGYRSNGTALWSHQGDGDGQAVVEYGGYTYTGHHFDLIDNVNTRQRFASFESESGVLTSWAPAGNSQLGVWDMAVTPYGLISVGEFTRVNDEVSGRIALFGYQS